MFRKIIEDISIKPSKESIKLANKYGYRPYMIERYLNMFSLDEVVDLLEAFEKKLNPVIRCNDVKVECQQLIKSLGNLGFKLVHLKWSKVGFRVVNFPESPTIGSTHEYLKGYYYVYRDAASLIPPIILNPKPNDVVLDMCAAPGGKATHIAQLMENKGILIANDISLSRLNVLKNHVKRMGFTNIVITNFDGRKIDKFIKFKLNKVLLDAPCSAEGAIMFDPERKTKTSIYDLAKIIDRELKLLDSAIKILNVDGIVVYTTCSIAPEENEYVISKILEKWGDKVIVEKPKLNLWSKGITEFHKLKFHEEVKECIRVWPHKHNMEGFFVCILRRVK